jgi:hypothetical protein
LVKPKVGAVDLARRARAAVEAELLKSGRAGLTVVFASPHATVYAVPGPHPLVTGPGRARVLALDETHARLLLPRPGTYRLAIKYSPYWRTSAGCLDPEPDGMTRISLSRSGVVELAFTVTAARALASITGGEPDDCD